MDWYQNIGLGTSIRNGVVSSFHSSLLFLLLAGANGRTDNIALSFFLLERYPDVRYVMDVELVLGSWFWIY
jgi:hypothetical protein